MYKRFVFAFIIIFVCVLLLLAQKILTQFEFTKWAGFGQTSSLLPSDSRSEVDKITLLREIPPPTQTPIPTPLPSPSPTLIPTTWPTFTPTKTAVPIPTVASTNTPLTAPLASSDEKKTYIVNAINAYRASKGLSNVQMDSYTCDFAKMRAREIASTFSHGAFKNRVDNHLLPYPNYSLVTENLAKNSNYKNVVTRWINSAGHRENMEKDTTYVCVEASGNYYAYEGWKP